MEKKIENLPLQKLTILPPYYFKPIDPGCIEKACRYCTYLEQDIDTYPCARCHTRH